MPKRRYRPSVDIWPGFVDALATLLMVIVLALISFVVSQMYLNESLLGKNDKLKTLEQQVKKLRNSIKGEQEKRLSLQQTSASLTSRVATLKQKITSLHEQLLRNKKVIQQHDSKNITLLKENQTLQLEYQTLIEALDLHEHNNKVLSQKVEETISSLQDALKDHINNIHHLQEEKKKNHHLSAINHSISQVNLELQSEAQALKAERQKAQDSHQSFETYRSKFLSDLVKILGNRKDIRIVDDRFIFQSEVLFAKASAELETTGRKQLDGLAHALKDISENIPSTISWILRVDGHTDQLPIRSSYASNWELSAARAIAVVKYLISKGIAPEHLVAAGFGEFQPITAQKDEESLARNRRIEFKLDQK